MGEEWDQLTEDEARILDDMRMSQTDTWFLFDRVIDLAEREASYSNTKAGKRNWMITAAQRWLTTDTTALRYVCHLAGADHSRVLERNRKKYGAAK